MQSIVAKTIKISAIAGSDLTIDRSIESISLTVLEEALKKLPVQGFLDTVTDAMKSDSITVSATLSSVSMTISLMTVTDHRSRSPIGRRKVALGATGDQNCSVTVNRTLA